MDIDLTAINREDKERIDITNTYKIDSNYFTNSSVKDVKDLSLTGEIYRRPGEDINEEINYIKASVTATLVLEDSISLEPVDYKISFEYDDIIEENWKKDENTLDILPIIWENILMEVPLKVVSGKKATKTSGDGWKLITEEEKRVNPELEKLKELL